MKWIKLGNEKRESERGERNENQSESTGIEIEQEREGGKWSGVWGKEF